MHIQSFPALSRLTLVIGLALSSLGAAHAADIASASASLSGLRYRLIDLDLNDDITPSLSLGGQLVAGGYTTVKNPDGFIEANPLDTDRIVTAPWLSTDPVSWASAAPGASATLGSLLTASAVVSGEALATNNTFNTNSYTFNSRGLDPDGVLRYTTETVTTTTKSILVNQDVMVVAEPETEEVLDEFGNIIAFGDQPNLTLSANTLLILEGTFGIQVSADSQSLASVASSALSPDVLNRGYSFGSLKAFAGIAISPTSIEEKLPGGSTLSRDLYADTTLAQELNFDFNQVTRAGAAQELGAAPNAQLSGGDARAFALTLANTSSSNMQAYLGMALQLSINANASLVDETRTITYGDAVPNGPVVTPVPGIPEPSTYALMGLGLVGIVLARRRLRPTQAA